MAISILAYSFDTSLIAINLVLKKFYTSRASIIKSFFFCYSAERNYQIYHAGNRAMQKKRPWNNAVLIFFPKVLKQAFQAKCRDI